MEHRVGNATRELFSGLSDTGAEVGLLLLPPESSQPHARYLFFFSSTLYMDMSPSEVKLLSRDVVEFMAVADIFSFTPHPLFLSISGGSGC